jgi:hypothetical protein
VARQALSLMHYCDIEPAIAAADPAFLCEVPEPGCVKGCYRCLLSYYNQPDHERIDRTDPAALKVLLRLARSRTVVSRAGRDDAPSGKGPWRAALMQWRLPLPDAEPVKFGDLVFPLHWKGARVAASLTALTPAAQQAAESSGYEIVQVPEQPGTQPPEDLASLLGVAV